MLQAEAEVGLFAWFRKYLLSSSLLLYEDAF